MGIPPSSETADAPRDEQVPYISSPARRPSCNSAEPTPPAAPRISTRWLDLTLNGMMQHLVCRDVVQQEADSLGGIQPRWHRNQFPLRQADELRVRAAD